MWDVIDSENLYNESEKWTLLENVYQTLRLGDDRLKNLLNNEKLSNEFE